MLSLLLSQVGPGPRSWERLGSPSQILRGSWALPEMLPKIPQVTEIKHSELPGVLKELAILQDSIQ